MLHNLFKQYSDFQFSSILSLFQDYFFITYIVIHSYLSIYKLKISLLTSKPWMKMWFKKVNIFVYDKLVKKAKK